MSAPLVLSPAAARGLMLHKLHLATRTDAGPARVADDLVGLHATGAWAPYLSLGARIAGFDAADLDAALYTERSLVRVRGMRGTLFVVSRTLLPIVQGATAAMCTALTRRYLASFGVTEEAYADVARRTLELVTERPRTATEIRRALGDAPAALSPLLYRMADEGLVVRDAAPGGHGDNAWRYAPFTALLPDVVLDGIAEDAAAAELFERYVAAYGPVTEADAAWWSGLTLGTVREALRRIAGRLVECRVAGSDERRVVHECDVAVQPAGLNDSNVRLLPSLDPYVMGYRGRSLYFEPALAPFVVDRAGNITSTIIVEGRIAGVWDVDEPAGRILWCALRPISTASEAAIESEAATIGRLRLGREPAVERLPSMPSLAAGGTAGFLAPLRPRVRRHRTERSG